MPTCNLCQKEFPNWIKINNKKVNLSKRKYCIECSPYGKHNTRPIKQNIDPTYNSKCIKCNKVLTSKRRKYCYGCNVRKRRDFIKNKIYGIVGYSCWCCGYNAGKDGTPILEFHHINESEKLFDMSLASTTSIEWKKVELELKKCCLLCCRCHREYHHTDRINDDQMLKIYQDNWIRINNINNLL